MSDDVIDAYTFGLEQPEWPRYEETLAPDELDRAARFRFARDRRRFVVGRAQMRAILGTYLGQDGRRLQFCYGPYGKPALQGSPLAFSMSRAHELGVVAVQRSGGAEIGVDVELLRPFPEALDIARRFFAADEYARLASISSDEVSAVFFEYWTHKEALVKSAGLGLSQAIDLPADRWVAPLHDLPSNYVGALASTVPPSAVRCRRWPQ